MFDILMITNGPGTAEPQPAAAEVQEVHDEQGVKGNTTAALHSTPLARVWVYIWAVLTWLLVFSFCVLLLVVFTGSKSSGVEGGKPYKRSHTVVQTFKCLEKVPWTDWQSVFDIYADPIAKAEVPATPLGTAGESAKILDHAMKAMRCHGNTAKGEGTPLSGGITGAVASDVQAALSFEFSSDACLCVHRHHTAVFTPAYVGLSFTSAVPMAAQVKSLGIDFVGAGGDGREGMKSLMGACFFGSRMPYHVHVMPRCMLAVSPFMVVLYMNAIAGIYAALYIISPGAEAASQPGGSSSYGGGGGSSSRVALAVSGLKSRLSLALGSYYAVGFFALLNLSVGIAGVVVAQKGQEATSIAMVVMVLVVSLIVVVSLVLVIKMGKSAEAVAPTAAAAALEGLSADAADPKRSMADRLALGRARATMAGLSMLASIGVTQRMAFWAQYIFTLPGLVLLHDAMLQQRVYGYLIGRVTLSLGLGFLAAGCDMLSVFHERVLQRLRDSDSEALKRVYYRAEDNVRSAAWWAWYVWIAAAAMMVHTSLPISLPSSVTDLVPGAHTMIPVALAVYVLGMPLVCIPGLATLNVGPCDWKNSADSTALGLRLVVDLVARVACTLTLLFWLYTPAYGHPV